MNIELYCENTGCTAYMASWFVNLVEVTFGVLALPRYLCAACQHELVIYQPTRIRIIAAS